MIRHRDSRAMILRVMSDNQQQQESLVHTIIGAFYQVYRVLGFGFLEQIYANSLERELERRGHHVAREVLVLVKYDGEEVGRQRLDLVVDGTVIVEIKATRDLPRNATRQVYNYLRATDLECGVLLHFGPEPRFYRVVGPKGGSERRRR